MHKMNCQTNASRESNRKVGEFDEDWIVTTLDKVTVKVKRVNVKQCIAVNGTPISQLWAVTCHMGSHSVTCHPTQVNTPRLNPSQ